MIISELIELLHDYQKEEGDSEIQIYDRHGDTIEPSSVQSGVRNRRGKATDFVYLSDDD